MKKVILSLDTGIDDAMALAYTIAKDELDLIGVVGTYGNVYTEQGAKNALALLKMLGKTDIPVFLGNDHAIDQDHFDRMEVSADIHGENGIGQVSIPAARRP
ncbi:nucleoside hydrolase, partial [Veillonellaceae bacterium M2-4]|nr:nucleoside hydrolase [Veillonellaceae bacterium M2-4]